MYHYCDYDAIEHYQSGAFNSKYKTELDGKIKEVDRICYDDQITCSFRSGAYQSFQTLAPLTLYRVFGQYDNAAGDVHPKGARLRGAFASTEFAESIIDAKLRLALDPAWFNTKMYEAKLQVPAGTTISVGIVAEVRLKTGTILPGGADQILLPFDWPEHWIVGYRRITGRQLQSPPYFSPCYIGEHDQKEHLYRMLCPACGCENIRRLSKTEEFAITGCKGTVYTMKYTCMNQQCLYYW